MRLLFLILAHDRPADVAELAQALTESASDGRAIIHFDAAAAPQDAAALAAALAGRPCVSMVRARVRCPWGSYGLVQAVLNALAEADLETLRPDYVILLSGACLPGRPVAALERHLAQTQGTEFIEARDDSWITGGLRAERHQFYFLLEPKAWPETEKRLVWLQRRLGVRRRFPRGLTPRFGSQWWAMTGETCARILAFARDNPAAMRFFRRVWIPDEMVFPTLAAKLVPPERIANRTLTLFQFGDRGKPLVFHDDHADYALSLNACFLRKVSPAAGRLRAACLARARAPDDGADEGDRSRLAHDYVLKAAAQTWRPVPGQPFYRDQFSDQSDSVLARAERPYVVLLGPRGATGAVASALRAALPEPDFRMMGEPFRPGRVDFGSEGSPGGGLDSNDGPIRDLHPALYLARLVTRSRGLPILRWSPGDAAPLMEAVLRDRNALVVALAPFDRDLEVEQRAWRLLSRSSEARPATPPGVDADVALRVWADQLGAPGDDVIGGLCRALFHAAPGEGAMGDRVIAAPFALSPRRAAATAAARRRRFERDRRACAFAGLSWFDRLDAALAAAWNPLLAADLPARFDPPLSPHAAAALRLLADGDREAPAPDLQDGPRRLPA